MNGLSLAMVVNNDADGVALVLKDVLDLCDELIVIDTGSSDDTIRVAQALQARYFHFTPNGDESAIRNYATSKCSGEWVMFLDPYDRILPASKESFRAQFETVRNNSEVEVISLQTRSNYYSELWTSFLRSSYRQTIYRKTESLEWRGIVDPVLHSLFEPKLLHEDAWIANRRPFEKERSRSLSALSDLEAASTNNNLSGRELIRFAQELKTHGRVTEADENFERATLVELPIHERYELFVEMATCSKELNELDQSRQSLAKAVALDSSRAEAFLQLGILHFESREWERAIPLFRAASIAQRPKMCLGDFDEGAYEWLPWDYLSVCASELGRYEDAIDFTFRALPGNPERERLLANMRHIMEQKKENAS